MRKLRITVQLSDAFYHQYEEEARRENVDVESLVEQTANTLLRELEKEEEDSFVSPS